MTDKYLLIGKKYPNLIRGAHTVSLRLVEHLLPSLDYIEHVNIKNVIELNRKYKKLIFVTQVPHLYSFPVNVVTLRKLNYGIYIRGEHNNRLFESITNGYSHYKEYPSLNSFIPFITDFHLNKAKEYKRPCLGFYLRRNCTLDSYKYFLSMIDNIKCDIDICILGETSNDITKYKNVINYHQTYDNQEFFKHITHYVYPPSKICEDPFPHSILEAVQSNKQIIIPDIERNFNDGIDDIKSCILYHTTFNPNKEYDNSECVLTFDNFKSFYKKIIDSDFINNTPRSYDTFYDWIIGEII